MVSFVFLFLLYTVAIFAHKLHSRLLECEIWEYLVKKMEEPWRLCSSGFFENQGQVSNVYVVLHIFGEYHQVSFRDVHNVSNVHNNPRNQNNIHLSKLILCRVRRSSTWSSLRHPTFLCMRTGCHRVARARCSLVTRWTSATAASSNRVRLFSSRLGGSTLSSRPSTHSSSGATFYTVSTSIYRFGELRPAPKFRRH